MFRGFGTSFDLILLCRETKRNKLLLTTIKLRLTFYAVPHNVNSSAA